MDKISEKATVQERIKMKHCQDDNFSYYIDANELLRGKWEDYKELNDKGPNNEAMFGIIKKRYSQWTIINEYGLFYNIFSCKKYDNIIKISEELYICEKNGRFGLLDNNEKTILHTCYNDIKLVQDNLSIFLVSTETGMFIFNNQTKIMSEIYEEIVTSLYGYFIFKESEKYGLLDNEGKIILEPKYEEMKYYLDTVNQLQFHYQNHIFGIFVSNNLLYGKIPINKYDLCFKVGGYGTDHYCRDYHKDCYYITKKGSKYGLINIKLETVCEPCLDEIVINISEDDVLTRYKILGDKLFSALYVIGRNHDLYTLFDTLTCKCILSECEEMAYTEDRRGITMVDIVYKKNGKKGFVTCVGKIISEEEYDSIDIFRSYFRVSKFGKYGEIDEFGKWVTPCIYDSIRFEYGDIVATKDGVDEILHPRSMPDYENSHEDYDEYGYPSYGKYAGSYAQDEAGYSDDDIDTVLDGDPSAYWNID